MASVWVIEDGCYSDYRVVGVFSTKENAEKVLQALKEASGFHCDEPTMAEWPLDPGVDLLDQGLKYWRVLMYQDGRVEEVCQLWVIGSEENHAIWQRSQWNASPDVLAATVLAKDAEHAVKIVNEKRVQLIANNEWKEA